MRRIKSILVFLIMTHALFGAKVSFEHWEKDETFSEYLISRNIPIDILQAISEADLEFLSAIESDQLFYELKDQEGHLEQVLIPIGEEMQIRLAKERESGSYSFDIIPIEYKEEEYSARVTIEKNIHTDIDDAIHHPALADKMSQLLKGTIDTKSLKKGDKVFFIYTQKTRMGKPYTMPQIKIAMVDSGGSKEFIYASKEGYGYKSDKKSQAYTVTGQKKVIYTRRVAVGSEASRFGMPIRNVRITSSFSYKRYHPILHCYRPHNGTDFGAKRGTPLLAVNAGKVSFAGRLGSYGNVVKIKHAGGYESLYAHQSRIHVEKGQDVQKGQIIGYVGSTGRSTGAHLHFGLMKKGRWINPMKVLRKESIASSILKKFIKYESVTTTKHKEVVIKDAKKNKAKLLSYMKEEETPFVWNGFEQNSIKVQDEKHNRKF